MESQVGIPGIDPPGPVELGRGRLEKSVLGLLQALVKMPPELGAVGGGKGSIPGTTARQQEKAKKTPEDRLAGVNGG